SIPGFISCPKCGEPIMGHRVCKACGYYNGKEVVKKEA
ncbi:MAG: 50S ribosomal protein L32, partial [Clostridia bacterium]|nr:50S ribosomal protein L32 [Clostridia bacterium]